MIGLKKGDNVQILKGKDRGKSGKILRINPRENRAVVEGLNLVKKNIRPKREGEKGQIISIPQSVSLSNLAFLCEHCRRPVRLGIEEGEKGKKRYCRKCRAVV